jgi:hypothetical protein
MTAGWGNSDRRQFVFFRSILIIGIVLAALPVEARAQSVRKAAPGDLPAAVPLGAYSCESLLSGSISGSAVGMTIGRLRVVDKNVYESLVKEGKGRRAAFGYDARTGNIEWEGGVLAGFFGKVTASRFLLDNRRKPVIQVTYRVREGGNLFDLSCQFDS